MLYEGQTICYSTKHGKEKQSDRLFRVALGAKLFAPPGIDTDVLGTFSGDVPRNGSPRDVVKRKCLMGLELSGLSVGLANEGSFGPHPYIPFIPNGVEVMCFIDNERGIEIFEYATFCRTNFSQSEVSCLEDLHKFMHTIGFPKHSLIIRPSMKDTLNIYKGLNDLSSIETAYQECHKLSLNGAVSVESDMRAHHNLIRRRTLIKLTKKMVQRLLRPCPKCKLPGWGETARMPGLPCSLCFSKTLDMRCRIFTCPTCQHEERIPASKHAADPKFCPHCNP